MERAAMCRSVRGVLFLILIAASVAGASNQFVARYVPIGASGSADLLAVDASGNFFIVANVQEPSGRPQIRAVKADPQGNVLASFDFGGSSDSFQDAPSGAAVDPQGNLVIVGTTASPDFPLVSPLISKVSTPAGFVVKLDSQLTKILFSTLLGGSQGSSSANAVVLDTAGNIYLAGGTGSSDFPTTPGAFQTTGPAETNSGFPTFAFVTEISPNGSSIIFSTFFGSDTADCTGDCIGDAGSTVANAMALDSSGALVIGGNTTANRLPVTPGTLGQQCDECGYPTPDTFVQSGFLAKFAPGGEQLDWVTYIPLAQTGPEPESAVSITGVALDADGNVIFGGSAPTGLVLTDGALQGSYPGNPSGQAGFVAKVNASASGYLFSTYFGDGIYQSPRGALTLDSQGDIWLTGGSDPSALPFPISIPPLGDTYIAELSADGSSILGGITAPAGAAGQAIVLTPTGSPAALGGAGSLLLNSPGQPASLVGVANSAGIHVSSNVAPYELVSFYGVALGPAKALGAQMVKGALTTSLGGVQVLFNDVAAPLLYVGPNQINAIVPSSVFGQDTAAIQIVTPGGTLTGPLLSVVPSEPEVFQNSPPMPAGGAAIALNQDGTLNSATNPASGGSIVTVWATGGGLDSPILGGDGGIPVYLNTPLLPVSVLNASYSGVLGLDSLEVLYAGDAPGLVRGVLQVNFRLPENVFNIYQLACQLQVGAAVSSRFSIYVKQ
jgi:uncharacterized protein (TIGR03437 family)